jgi:hypothetical protein
VPTIVAPRPAEILRPDTLVLSGIFGGHTGRTAFITGSNSGDVWLHIDDDIDGWTIAEIGPDWITLTAGSDSVRLELFE